MNKNEILNALNSGLDVVNIDGSKYITRSKGINYIVFKERGQGFIITNFDNWSIKSDKWRISSYSEYLAK